MGAKDKWNRGEVYPKGSGRKITYDSDGALQRVLLRAAADGLKFLLNEAGEVIEFGTALIVNNDGTKTKTKNKQ